MNNRYYRVHKPHRFSWLSRLIILILVIFIFWIIAQWLRSLMQPYFPVKDQTRIAQVHVILAHEPGYMDIDLTIFASDGHQTSENSYLLKGNMWRLEGELITIPDALNYIGLYSGYKLTQLDGRYVPATASNATSSVGIENANDDGFFKTLNSKPNPVLQAYKMYSNYIPDDGKSYDIFITQNGLSAESSS